MIPASHRRYVLLTETHFKAISYYQLFHFQLGYDYQRLDRKPTQQSRELNTVQPIKVSLINRWHLVVVTRLEKEVQ